MGTATWLAIVGAGALVALWMVAERDNTIAEQGRVVADMQKRMAKDAKLLKQAERTLSKAEARLVEEMETVSQQEKEIQELANAPRLPAKTVFQVTKGRSDKWGYRILYDGKIIGVGTRKTTHLDRLLVEKSVEKWFGMDVEIQGK